MRNDNAARLTSPFYHMSPDGRANRIVFITVPGDSSSVSRRDRELQAATARAHAARVSHRSAQKAGVVKHESSGHSRTKSAAAPGAPSAIALRTTHEIQRRRARIAKEIEKDHETPLAKTRHFAVSTSSLGQGQVDPFDSGPVKGLDNFIYSLLDFGWCYGD